MTTFADLWLSWRRRELTMEEEEKFFAHHTSPPGDILRVPDYTDPAVRFTTEVAPGAVMNWTDERASLFTSTGRYRVFEEIVDETGGEAPQ